MSALPAAGTLAGEATRAALVAALVLAMLATTEWIYRRFKPPAEWTRKFIHVGGGILAMAFPWIFGSAWTVAVVGLAMGALLAIGGRLGLLTGITGVERRSRGEIYHPIAVVLLFLLTHHQPIFYVISLWTLVVADAAAALLGKSYGRHTYAIEDDRKSLEGSVVFFFVAFIGIHVPLLLWTDVSREASLIISLQLALLVTCFEAISMQGADNLVVPLATYYLLLKLTANTAEGIVLQLAAQVAILTAMLVLARRTRFLTWAGAVAAHLTLYAAWSLGGPAWVVAPALALAGFLLLEPDSVLDRSAPGARHQVRGVFYVSIVAVVLLGVDNSLGLFRNWRHPFYVPFVAAFAAQLAIRLLRRRRGWSRAATAHHDAPRARGLAGDIVLSAVIGFAIVAAVGLALNPGTRSAGAFAGAAGICIAATAFYALVFRRLRPAEDQLWELRSQSAAVAVAVLAWLPIHFATLGSVP